MNWPAWLTLDFWKGLWDDFTEYGDDLPIKALKGVLEAVAEQLEALPVPDFLNGPGIADVLGPAMPYIGYFLQQSGVGQAVSLIIAAIGFRITRKAVTFGIW